MGSEKSANQAFPEETGTKDLRAPLSKEYEDLGCVVQVDMKDRYDNLYHGSGALVQLLGSETTPLDGVFVISAAHNVID